MFVAAESHTVASRYVQLLHHLSVRQTESSRFFFPAGFVHCYSAAKGNMYPRAALAVKGLKTDDVQAQPAMS